jgi:hypothetical protein
LFESGVESRAKLNAAAVEAPSDAEPGSSGAAEPGNLNAQTVTVSDVDVVLRGIAEMDHSTDSKPELPLITTGALATMRAQAAKLPIHFEPSVFAGSFHTVVERCAPTAASCGAQHFVP